MLAMWFVGKMSPESESKKKKNRFNNLKLSSMIFCSCLTIIITKQYSTDCFNEYTKYWRSACWTKKAPAYIICLWQNDKLPAVSFFSMYESINGPMILKVIGFDSRDVSSNYKKCTHKISILPIKIVLQCIYIWQDFTNLIEFVWMI